MYKKTISSTMIITLLFLSASLFGCNKATQIASSDASSITTESTQVSSEDSSSAISSASDVSSEVSAESSVDSVSVQSTVSSSASSSSAPSSSIASSAGSSSAASSEDYTFGTATLTTNMGALPSVTTPAVGGVGSNTADGKWYINNLSKFVGDRLVVNAKDEHGIAFYVAKGLGDTWSASGTFRYIKRYPEDQPVCARLFINDVYGVEVMILTVNYVNNSVEIVLQELDRVWKTLITTDGWVETSSTVFSFGIRRQAGSKKVDIYVQGDKGMLLTKTSPVNIPDALLARAAVAGFGTYSSAVEYSSMHVVGNGPANVVYMQTAPE